MTADGHGSHTLESEPFAAVVTFFTMSNKLYLASTSPRRRELLHQIGVHFLPLVPQGAPGERSVDETPLTDESVGAYVDRLARAKATHGLTLLRMRHMPLRPILAADTALSLDGKIIGKPRNLDDARRMLQRLSGRSHEVHSAVAIHDGMRCEALRSVSTVHFARLDEITIRQYLSCGESLDKAGGYAVQGRAAVLIERIEGSYSGIMGLPLFETAQLLTEFGIAVLR